MLKEIPLNHLKPVYTFLLFLFGAFTAQAQYPNDSKRDMLWPSGYGFYPGQTNPLAGLTWLDYNSGIREQRVEYKDIDFWGTNAVICDEDGELEIFTNGIFIYDRNGDVIQDCDTLNPGYWANSCASTDAGYPVHQGALILPYPGKPNYYCVFHSWMSNGPSSYGFYEVKHVYYTIVFSAQDFGVSAVDSFRKRITSTSPFANDTIDYGKLTACRHANGRDWWVLFCKNSTKEYRRILLDDKGVHDYGWFPTGQTAGIKYTGLGQARFTANGKRYLNQNALGIDEGEFLDIYDFDRCNGSLSNPLRIQTFDTCYGVGLAVSSNARYAYTSCSYKLFQWDLEAVDIADSKKVVAQWDGFIDPEFIPYGETAFFFMGNTPDGKINIVTPNNRFVHIIDNPNEADTLCNVIQHGIELFTFNLRSIANYPNFRLGADTGSACDTLGIGVGIQAPCKPNVTEAHIQAYPNPATDYCNVGFGTTLKQAGQLIVYNAAGQRVYEAPLNKATIGYTLKTSEWQRGMYLCVVYEGGSEKGRVRVVKE